MAQQNMEVVSAAFEAFRKLAVSQTKRPMRLRNRTSIPAIHWLSALGSARPSAATASLAPRGSWRVGNCVELLTLRSLRHRSPHAVRHGGRRGPHPANWYTARGAGAHSGATGQLGSSSCSPGQGTLRRLLAAPPMLRAQRDGPASLRAPVPSMPSGASQAQQQVADGGRLGQERVVTGVELYDAAGPASELALAFGGSAPVLGADEVRRSHVLPHG